MDLTNLKNEIINKIKAKYGIKLEEAKEHQILNVLSEIIMEKIADRWYNTKEKYSNIKNAYYLSAEYLMGRTLTNNLINLNIYNEVKNILNDLNIDINKIEDIEEDFSVGNGGLGRLAACFLDSGATNNLPLYGYGIRYSHGLFKQYFENGFQKEVADNWLKYGDSWSIRNENDIVEVKFKGLTVKAVPYDTPIIGYGTNNINTLRLWQAEPIVDFDFNLFNEQKYDEAVKEKTTVENISRVLYPNDWYEDGKLLRLRQQYFMVSASLQDAIRRYIKNSGDNNLENFENKNIFQLNDTHPVLAIPEFIRILMSDFKYDFYKAFDKARLIFGYTNHTILAEALEKWDINLMLKLSDDILDIIYMINEMLIKELKEKGYNNLDDYYIVKDNQVRMANMAIFMSISVNGVATLHTEILKNIELNNWYKLYPEKFQNKTNGITQRRWLKSANKELAEFITELLGSDSWVTNLNELKKLEKYANNKDVLNKFLAIKYTKKTQLADYIEKNEGIVINPDSLFDVQVKRLHEYKRQLLNALYIYDLYCRVKSDPNMDIPNITFIFGAKAFPGYTRAKAIIKYINELANLINNDEEINGKIKVVFVQNYRVSYAEKIIPAADISKQISLAGKEASGTGNMKLMLNGALTFGTLDGANVEIVEQAGIENNFIFGLTVDGVKNMKNNYNAKNWYYDKYEDIRNSVDSLINGVVSDNNTGMFKDLYNSLIYENDNYLLLADFHSFKNQQDKVFIEYNNRLEWAKKAWLNICNAGEFSSDRTINQYAKEIWQIESIKL